MESYDRIPQEAQALLHLLAFFGSDDLAITLIVWQGENAYPEPLQQAAQDTATLSPLFSKLHDAGLVEPVEGTQGETWTVHRLTQAVIRAKLQNDKAYDTWATAAARLVHAMLPASASNPENWPMFAAMQPHVEVLLHHGPETGDGGKALNVCLDHIGSYLSVRGDAAGSLPYQQKSLALSKAIYGEESEQFATALNQLATTYIYLGNLEEAETLLQRALKIDRTLLPIDHPNLAPDLNNLARVHLSQEKFADAENALKEALRITEAAFGADSPVIASHLDNLGVFYSERRDWDKANELHQRALDIRRVALGELHQLTATSYYNCAPMELNRGNNVKALQYCHSAVAINYCLRMDQVSWQADLNVLIQLLQTSGQNQQAEALQNGDFSSLDPLIEELKCEHEAGKPQREARIAAIIADMEAIAAAADFDATDHIHQVRTGSQDPDWGRQWLKDAIRERDEAAGAE